MEITIDFDLIRRIAREESRRTRDDTAVHGALKAFALSQGRHDERLATATDAASLACVEGCAYCCHFRVDVRSAEVIAILEFMDATFTPEQSAHVLAEVRARAKLIAELTEEEHHQRNIACAFLVNGRCSIYPVRPQTCRNYHATDVRGCERNFHNPTEVESDPDYAPGVYQAGGAHVDAVARAMKGAGFNVSVYEMNTALAAAANNREGVRNRFENGADPLPHVDGFEPPAEFIDLLE